MIEGLKNILLFIQEDKTRASSFCCRMIFVCIAIWVGSLFFFKGLLGWLFLSDILTGVFIIFEVLFVVIVILTEEF